MSSLTQIALTAKTWADVSGEMVSGTRYRLVHSGRERVRYAEKATTPTATTSYAVRNEGAPVDYLYSGTAIWAYSTAPDVTVNVLTLAG